MTVNIIDLMETFHKAGIHPVFRSNTARVVFKEIKLTPDDVDDLPQGTQRRIIRKHVVECKSFTSLIDQLRTLTIGDLENPEAVVEVELCALDFKLGETLGELLERYQLLLVKACAIGLKLSDKTKMSYMMAVVGKYYGSLSLQMRTINKVSTAFSLLHVEAKSQDHKRTPVPRASTKEYGTSAKRRSTGCWNCDVPGHHSTNVLTSGTMLR
ncbi:hypothetical protein Cpir12675_000577 [Ceratocystis pirilliformis]|uniref:Uncharacterized protein n=1 Tax=Ceratocystis pirilliformis TaxID=259994 RepID=A0ABR3ZMB4_9PEZI